MIVLDQIIDLLESLLRVYVAVVVDGFLNACKEVVKFVLILLLLYHLVIWSFQFLEEVLPETENPIESVLTPESPINNTRESDLMAHQILGETCLRIGPPDENLVKPTASYSKLYNQLENVLPETENPIESGLTPESPIKNTRETDLVAHKIMGETCLRIGPPDENLIKQRASLLEQLEIEAEFEENQAKLKKSEADLEQFVKKEIHTVASKTRESEDFGLNKDHFISQIKQELYETSRASQTIKTSLGKKSKLKEHGESGSSNRDYNAQEEDDFLKKFKTNNHLKIEEEVSQDFPATAESTSSKLQEFKNVEKRQFYDDQYDHESFHRV